MKTDITSRKDVSKIVREFYLKVRKEELLGPIFNEIISDWEEHLERLTDFWEMNLFGGKMYSGNPIAVHQQVDKTVGNTIEAFHFGTWIALWFLTINENFEGENAEVMKRRARKMQTGLLVAIYQNRHTNENPDHVS